MGEGACGPGGDRCGDASDERTESLKGDQKQGRESAVCHSHRL